MKTPIDQIEGYLPLTKSFLKGKKAEQVIAVKASNDAPKENLVGGKEVNKGDYILADVSDKFIVDGEMYLAYVNDMFELVKVFQIDEGYQFHRTMDSFIHVEDNPELIIMGKAFKVLKIKHGKGVK